MNVDPADVPLVVVTVTLTPPGLAIRLAGTAAVSSTELTNAVVSAVVPHVAVAPGTKFVPLIVKVKAAPPRLVELGLRLVIASSTVPAVVKMKLRTGLLAEPVSPDHA